jgi:crossover junction endodeoxyribonuclease RuvC
VTTNLFTPDSDVMPIVVGLDLSLTATGYAGPDGTRTFTSTGHKGDTLAERSCRLSSLANEIAYATRYAAPGTHPDLVVIEAPAFSRTQGAMHDRSGLWWLVTNWLIETDAFEVIEVSPTALKKYVTGKGNAAKGDMRMAIYKRFSVDIADDNEADAFALRTFGLDLLGHPLAPMPAANRAALETVPRPTLRGAA